MRKMVSWNLPQLCFIKPIWQMFGMNLFNWITMNCIKSQKCWNLFPVLSYKIDYIKFYTPVKNEVKCTIVMQKGESGTPIATSSWYFKLMNYLGGWRLCMMN